MRKSTLPNSLSPPLPAALTVYTATAWMVRKTIWVKMAEGSKRSSRIGLNPPLMPSEEANRYGEHNHPGKAGDEHYVLPAFAQHDITLPRFLGRKHDRFVAILLHAKSP